MIRGVALRAVLHAPESRGLGTSREGLYPREAPVGSCYRHNLARPEGGPRARLAQRIIVMGLRIGSCASGLRPGLAIYLDRCAFKLA
jgi:hypothetical protein